MGTEFINRKPGFYWVNAYFKGVENPGGWVVAEWCAQPVVGYWKVPGVLIHVYDNSFSEIDPEPIERLTMPPQRKAGFYWIKYLGEWVVAEWATPCMAVPGGWFNTRNTAEIPEHEIELIHETPLTPPHE